MPWPLALITVLHSPSLCLLNAARQDPENEGKWVTSVAVRQPWVKVEGWVLPELPPLITVSL